jgi:hypothetical protein
MLPVFSLRDKENAGGGHWETRVWKKKEMKIWGTTRVTSDFLSLRTRSL